jgi:hypothetical protein
VKDRREQIAGFIPLALIAPEPRHAHRAAEFINAVPLPTPCDIGYVA